MTDTQNIMTLRKWERKPHYSHVDYSMSEIEEKELGENIPHVYYSMDKVKFTSKPTTKDIGRIKKAIIQTQVCAPIDFLEKFLLEGNTISPALYTVEEIEGVSMTSNDARWLGQELFFIDIDDNLQYEEAKARWERFDLPPAFVYTTFSDTHHNKFRIVYLFEKFVTKDDEYKLITNLFHAFYIEADPKASSKSNIYFGGKELLYSGYESERGYVPIGLDRLIDATSRFYMEGDSANRSNRMKQFSNKTGIALLNGYPNYKVQVLNDTNLNETFVDNPLMEGELNKDKVNDINSKHLQYIAYYTCLKIIYIYLISSLGWEEKKPKKAKVSKDGKKEEKESVPLNPPFKRVRNVDFQKLIDYCHLAREFHEGSYWAYHKELFGLATNFINMEHGERFFREGLHSRHEYMNLVYGNKQAFFEDFYLGYLKKHRYRPSHCNSYCPHAETCLHGLNILDTISLKRGEIRRIKPLITIPLKEAESKLVDYIEEALSSPIMGEKDIFIIQAETGLGKTEALLPADLDEIQVIAFPTHKLKDEVAERFRNKGREVTILPSLPDLGSSQFHYAALHAQGSHTQATQFLHTIKNDIAGLPDYLKAFEELNDKDLIFTTHDRVILEPGFHDRTVLFDEDPFEKTLRQGTVGLDTLNFLNRKVHFFIEHGGQETDIEYLKEAGIALDALIGILRNLPDDRIGYTPEYEILQDKRLAQQTYKAMMDFVFENKIKNENLYDFFKSSYFIKIGEKIHYVKKIVLPFPKTIVLSASPITKGYEYLYEDRLHLFEIGKVEQKGKINQYTNASFSKSGLNNENLMGAIKATINEAFPLITFKKYEDMFESEHTAHFGDIEGRDDFKGMDLNVIGTYRKPDFVYRLIAACLGILIDSTENLNNRKVTYKGKEFYMMTYANTEFQQLQCQMIESEVLQAVGRARILRTEATVTLFSGFPIDGAEYRVLNIPKKQKDEESVLVEVIKSKTESISARDVVDIPELEIAYYRLESGIGSDNKLLPAPVEIKDKEAV